MKKLITVLSIAMVLVATSATNYAQKFGHLNGQEILRMLPDYTQAESELKTWMEGKQKVIQELQTTYQTQVQKYQTNEATMDNSEKELRQKEILQIEKNMQEFATKAEEDYMKKQEELMKPMLEKVQNAIKAVGKSNGFTYIFDISAGALVFTDGGIDVTDLVKKELGIS